MFSDVNKAVSLWKSNSPESRHRTFKTMNLAHANIMGIFRFSCSYKRRGFPFPWRTRTKYSGRSLVWFTAKFTEWCLAAVLAVVRCLAMKSTSNIEHSSNFRAKLNDLEHLPGLFNNNFLRKWCLAQSLFTFLSVTHLYLISSDF